MKHTVCVAIIAQENLYNKLCIHMDMTRELMRFSPHLMSSPGGTQAAPPPRAQQC